MRNRMMNDREARTTRATARKILSSRDRSFGTVMGRGTVVGARSARVSVDIAGLDPVSGSAGAPNQASGRTLPGPWRRGERRVTPGRHFSVVGPNRSGLGNDRRRSRSRRSRRNPGRRSTPP